MSPKQQSKKRLNLLQKLSLLLTALVLLILGDMIVAGTIYRPIVYVYHLKSWWDCNRFLLRV